MIAALGTVHAPGVIRQNNNGIVIAVGTARNLPLVHPGAADSEAVVTAIQHKRRHRGLATPYTDAGFFVLAELALESDKTTHLFRITCFIRRDSIHSATAYHLYNDTG